MIFRLDLTEEQKGDLMNYLGGLIPRGPYTYISSIELQTEAFLIRYKKFAIRYNKRSPMVIWKGSKEYDVIMNWFKPKMRDRKLEELGI